MDGTGRAATDVEGDDSGSSQLLARERDRLRLLLDVNNAVVSHLSLDRLLHAISKSLQRVVPHDLSSIALHDPVSGQLRSQVLEYNGEMPYFVQGGPIPPSGSTGAEAFSTGKPVFVNESNLERFMESEYFRKGWDAGLRSGGNVPLIAHGRTLGVMGLASFRENAFSDDDIDLLCRVASQIALAVENSLNYEQARDAERELKLRLDQLHLLLEVTNNVTSNLGLRELFKAITECLAKVIRFDGLGLSIYDEASGKLRILAIEQVPNPGVRLTSPLDEGQLIEMEGTPPGIVFKSRKTHVFTRAELESLPSPLVKQVLSGGVQTSCVAPLLVQGVPLGTIGVVSREDNAFTPDEAELINQIAGQVAIAVGNALNFQRAVDAEQQMARARRRSELLLEINNKIASSLELRDLFVAISGCLMTVLHHDYADIALYDEQIDSMQRYAVDRSEDIRFGSEDVWVPVEGTLAGVAIRRRETVIRERHDPVELHSELMARAYEEGLRSGCAVPLISRDRVLGVLNIASRKECAFTADDGQLLSQIGVQIALAVENSLSYEAVRSAEAQMQIDRDRFRLLLEVNNAVVSHLDLREVMKAISASLRGVIDLDLTGLALYDPESNMLRAHTLESFLGLDLPSEGSLFPIEGSPSGLAFTSGKTVYMNRPDPERYTSEFLRVFTDRGLKSLCAAPLIAHGKMLGILVVMSLREDSLTESDIELLTEIAKQIAIAVENALAFGELSQIKNKLAEEKVYLEEEINTAYDFEQIIGSSPALQRILKQVKTVAPTDSTVLIQGETGTGKEVIARAIHALSLRQGRTLVKINCAAIPTGLLESELFGHEKGAFTGAIAQRIGRFELANKGTLFLDEVGEIPHELQPKLLRVLQEREFERLGSTRTVKVDVRLIAATNRNLEQMVADRQFRDDLFYRLNVFPITIPPLRERSEDIPLLIRFFASKFARRMKKRIESIPAESIAALQQYHWPGNIRELENFIERAVILSQGPQLQVPLNEMKAARVVEPAGRERPAATPIEAAEPARVVEPAGREKTAATASQTTQPPSAESASLESVEREHILRVLRETNWVVGGAEGAAARLGLKRTTLQARMKKLGIARQ